MKRSALLSGLLAGALALSLSACSSGEPEPSLTPDAPSPTASAAPEPSSAAPVWGEQVFAKTFAAGDGETVLTVSLSLPLVQNTDACPAGNAVNDWYKAEGDARMLEAEDAYEMAVADYDVSQAAGLPFSPTTQEMTYQVAYEDGAVFSIRREFYVHYGSTAHPYAFLFGEVFDAQTGEELGASRFFTDPEAAKARAVEAFVEKYSLQDSRDAVEAACQAENFYLSEEGYVFWISGGTLPSANSPIEVTLPYDDMKDVSVDG